MWNKNDLGSLKIPKDNLISLIIYNYNILGSIPTISLADYHLIATDIRDKASSVISLWRVGMINRRSPKQNKSLNLVVFQQSFKKPNWYFRDFSLT